MIYLCNIDTNNIKSLAYRSVHFDPCRLVTWMIWFRRTMWTDPSSRVRKHIHINVVFINDKFILFYSWFLCYWLLNKSLWTIILLLVTNFVITFRLFKLVCLMKSQYWYINHPILQDRLLYWKIFTNSSLLFLCAWTVRMSIVSCTY